MKGWTSEIAPEVTSVHFNLSKLELDDLVAAAEAREAAVAAEAATGGAWYCLSFHRGDGVVIARRSIYENRFWLPIRALGIMVRLGASGYGQSSGKCP